MKILILTAVYPRPDAPFDSTATKVIQYFADAWKESGNEVVVVHTANRLPAPLYRLPKGIKDRIKAATGFEVPDRSITRACDYQINGIRVLRRPLRKTIPRRLHADRVIGRCAADIHASLQSAGFVPDLIVGHWASPNAQLLAALRTYYACPNAVVFHSVDYAQKYPKQMAKALQSIDRVGARSKAIANGVQAALATKQKPFVCYSGIPDTFAAQMQELSRTDFTQVKRFLYAGTLMARKNVDTVLRALADLQQREWVLDVVGEGDCMASLRELAVALNVADRVRFHGRLPRERVLEMMGRADVFTMVSRDEAFGLVYLEAMAAGCLTVGSCDEGIDGVIKDGENGFLCTAGDATELSAVYTRIFEMSGEARRTVAERGKRTALAMTDSAVAADYLKKLTQ